MIARERTRLAVVVAATAVLAIALLAGCTSGAGSAKAGPTALGSIEAAKSALSTMAPDAKLLVVQTAQAVEPTGTPMWEFLMGSPKTDKVYAVYVSGGKSLGAQEYGTAGLSTDQWKAVPTLDEWKTDSDAAYKAALAVSGAKGDPAAYLMGFLTYKPSTDTSTIEPFVWNVVLDPGTSGATTSTILVDAKTGKASIAK